MNNRFGAIFAVIGLLVGLLWANYKRTETKPRTYTESDIRLIAPESLFKTNEIEPDSQRSDKWEDFAYKIKGDHPQCAYCGIHGDHKAIEAHHIHAFELMTEARDKNGRFCLPGQKGTAAPGGELDPNNIILLCRIHHLSVGHLGNFKDSNPNVVEDCKKHRDRETRQ